MRLFIALDIDDDIRERISRFVEGVRNFAPDARWMKPESMHVTLKFIGEQPEESFESMKNSLTELSPAGTEIHFQGYGFFPTENRHAFSGLAWKLGRTGRHGGIGRRQDG